MKNQFPSYRALAVLGVTIAFCVISCMSTTQLLPTAEQELPPVETSTPAAPTSTPAPTPAPCIPGFAEPVIVFEYGPGTRFTDWVVADFTSDGLADIIVIRGMFVTTEDFPAYFFTNDGQGSFTHTTETTFAGSASRSQTPREVVLADFDGDDIMDVYIADHITYAIDPTVDPDADNRQVVSVQGLKTGLWKVKVDWKGDGRTFYKETVIII